MADPILIRIEDVTKIYPTSKEDVHALDTISLAIKEGEFVSLVGPSGCGKSTLMMLTAGLTAPTTGQITIAGELVTRPYTNLGIVFQRDVLLNWRTVLENVMLQTEIRRLKRDDYEPHARDLLRRVGLDGFEDAFPRELSGGMRQRVSICRALLHDPSMLLMDEPFGALDAITRDQMNLDLERIWEQSQKTVVFVTHSVPEAIFLSHRVLIMSPRPGRIVETIDIDLPRPRTLAMRDTPEFIAYNRKIRDIFKAQGILVDSVAEAASIKQNISSSVDY